MPVLAIVGFLAYAVHHDKGEGMEDIEIDHTSTDSPLTTGDCWRLMTEAYGLSSKTWIPYRAPRHQ